MARFRDLRIQYTLVQTDFSLCFWFLQEIFTMTGRLVDGGLIDNFRSVIIAISRWKAGKLDIEDTQFPFCTQYQNLF